MVDVYVENSIGTPEVIDEFELLHYYDEDTDVEVGSEHDDTDVKVVSEHVDAEVQGGNEHGDTNFLSGRDANNNYGDDDDGGDYVGSDGELGSLSDTNYDISEKSTDLDWKTVLPYENDDDKARHSDGDDSDVLLSPPNKKMMRNMRSFQLIRVVMHSSFT